MTRVAGSIADEKSLGNQPLLALRGRTTAWSGQLCAILLRRPAGALRVLSLAIMHIAAGGASDRFVVFRHFF